MSQPLRVAAITNLFPTETDPSQGTFIEQQVKGLRQAGVAVDVVHVDRRARGTAVYRELPALLARRIREFEPDLVHVMYGGVLADRVTHSVRSVPLIVSFCGSDLFGDAANGLMRRIAGNYGVTASQRAARRADGIVVKSPGLRDKLDPSIDAKRVWILPNGIDMERFRPLDRAECRRQLGWPDGCLNVLFPNAGTNLIKRLELAAAAVDRLKKLGVPAVLHTMGGVPHAEVPVWLNAADAVILTSSHEGSPNIVREALACDRPVVSVDVGDVRQRLLGIEGCHIARANPGELAKALAKVATGPRVVAGRTTMADSALENATGKLIEIYETVIERRRLNTVAAPRPVRSTMASLPGFNGPAARRWLILTQYYAPEPGAPQIRLRELSKELTRHGHEVEVLTGMPNYPTGKVFPEYQGKGWTTEEIDGVRVHRVPLYTATGRQSLRRILCYLSFTMTAMMRLPFLGKPDVIFVEAQPVTLALAAYLMKVLRGVPYIYNTPDLQVEIAGDSRWISLNTLVKLAGSLETFLMRRALCVSTVTHAFIDHFVESRGIERSHFTFLPNGADTDALRPMAPDADYARKLGVDGKVVFTYAGTHAPYQGLELILEAASHLVDRKDIVILMVGRGPIRESLQKQAAGQGLTNVVFGDSPFSEMANLMSITRASLATIAPMTSAAKMRLSKVVPPLACGVPVIYAGEGEWGSIVREQDCGRIIESRSATEFAAAIRELADNAVMAREMGARGRSYVERELSWRSIVERWLAGLEVGGAAPDGPSKAALGAKKLGGPLPSD